MLYTSFWAPNLGRFRNGQNRPNRFKKAAICYIYGTICLDRIFFKPITKLFQLLFIIATIIIIIIIITLSIFAKNVRMFSKFRTVLKLYLKWFYHSEQRRSHLKSVRLISPNP